jgi:hypothetical protein
MSYYIYQITGADMTYYGSSNQLGNSRINHHKSDYKCYNKQLLQGIIRPICSSYKIFNATDDWQMKIILDGIETENEALFIENEYINNNECVNINNALGLKPDSEELKEYKTKWARHDRLRRGLQPLIPIPNQSDEITYKKMMDYRAKYQEEHRIEINERSRKYHEDNRETILPKMQKYRDNHRDDINQKQNEKHAQNKEVENKAKRDRRNANKDEYNAKNRAYYQANKEHLKQKRIDGKTKEIY